MFPLQIEPSDLGFKASPSSVNFSDPFQKAFSKVLAKKLNVIRSLAAGFSCLSNIGKEILPKRYDILLDIVKHSQLGDTNPTVDGKSLFMEKYVNNFSFIENLTKSEPKFLTNELEYLDFCKLESSLKITAAAKNEKAECTMFRPTVTGRGLCHTFNGLPMLEVYKETAQTKLWSSTFEPKQPNKLVNPSGYGPSAGLNIVLNMYQTPSNMFSQRFQTSLSKAIFAITSEMDWLSVYLNGFIIEPGYSYTFKVVGSLMVTTERLNTMDVKARLCNLQSDSKDMDILGAYSKAGCGYECFVQQVIHKCKCVPWFMPKSANNTAVRYCEEKYTEGINEANVCLSQLYSEFSLNNCDCPSDCSGTSLTVFDFRFPLDNPGKYCEKSKSLEKISVVYQYNVLCDICRKYVTHNRVKLTYDYVVKNSTNPDDFYNVVCNDFLMENVAVIKVELSTPTLTRSVRDKRFNFEGQLSDLGKRHHPIYNF